MYQSVLNVTHILDTIFQLIQIVYRKQYQKKSIRLYLINNLQHYSKLKNKKVEKIMRIFKKAMYIRYKISFY